MIPGGAERSAQPQPLPYVAGTELVFANGSHQVVVVREFGLPTADPSDDRGVLARLIATPQYRASATGVGQRATVHGPYPLAAITADGFQTVDAAEAEAMIRRWAGHAGPPPEELHTPMERGMYPLLHVATSIYQLAPLPPQAWAPRWRWGVGSASAFGEFILINRTAAVVSVVITTDD